MRLKISELVLFVGFIFLFTSGSYGATIILDFSSGNFGSQPPLDNVNQYVQDGFSVKTAHLP